MEENETPPVTPPTDPTLSVNPPKESEPEWSKPLAELGEKVDGLAASVAALAPLPTDPADIVEGEPVIPDETPVKLPWTHRPLFGGN